MKTGCGSQPAIRLSFRGGDSDCRFNKVSSIRSPQALALPMQNFFREAKTKKGLSAFVKSYLSQSLF